MPGGRRGRRQRHDRLLRQGHDAARRRPGDDARPDQNRPIGAAEVHEKFGVGPDKVIDVQALCGDSVDNVPGVPGIGVKTAAELINTYGDLENLLARAAEIKQPKRRQTLIENESKARLSKELVKLDDDVPLPCPLAALGGEAARRGQAAAVAAARWNSARWRRACPSGSRGGRNRSGRAAGAGHPRDPALHGAAHLCAGRHGRGPRPLDRGGATGGYSRDLAGGEQVAGTRPALCGIALALAPGLAAYIPLGHARRSEAPPPLATRATGRAAWRRPSPAMRERVPTPVEPGEA